MESNVRSVFVVPVVAVVIVSGEAEVVEDRGVVPRLDILKLEVSGIYERRG